MPSELFTEQEIQDEELQEADCLQKLIDAGMPEKMKEDKTKIGGKAEKIGGFEVFIPKKRTNRGGHFEQDDQVHFCRG